MSSFYTRAEMQTLKTLLEAEFQSAQERSYPIKVRDPRAQALVKKIYAQERKRLAEQLPKDSRECMKPVARDVTAVMKGVFVCRICLAGAALLGVAGALFKLMAIQSIAALIFVLAFVVMNVLKASVENKLRQYLCLHLLSDREDLNKDAPAENE